MPLSKKQIEIIKYNNVHQPRITILEGAVRSGKTFIVDWLFWRHVLEYEGQGKRFIITGTTIPSIKRNILDHLSEMPGVGGISLNQSNEFQMFGNTVCCFGAKDTDSYRSMKGFTAHGWFGNEVTEHHINSIDQAFKRCSGEGSRIFWDTNPAGPNHFIKTNYVDRNGELLKDGSVHIKSWHFILDDNEFLDETYKDSLKKSIPTGMWYDRDILGLWVAAEGMIYRDFDLSKHVVDKLPKMKDHFAGVDWGFEHKGVIGLYGVDNDGNAYRIKEIVETQKTIGWWKAEAKKIVKDYGQVIFYCDPARPDFITELRQESILAREADNSVIEGITFIAEQFKNDRLFILRDYNKNYLSEIYNYRWKENVSREEPIKEDDHSMDSERYALYSHIGKSRQIKAVQSIYM